MPPDLKAEFESRHPEWVKMVQKAKKDSTNVLIMLLAFLNKPNSLYECLWYAYSEKVNVTFVSSEPRLYPLVLN